MPEDHGVRCASCGYYDPFSGYCCNTDSEHFDAFMPSYSEACINHVPIKEMEE